MAIPKGLSFDQLNQMYQEERKDKMRSMPYEQYFGEMDLSEEQKEKRIETADDLEEVFLSALILAYLMYQANMVNYELLQASTQQRYVETIRKHRASPSEEYISYHIPEAISGIINTTFANPDNPFNFSFDRAMLIAENEANDIWNNSEFAEAIENGMTTKTWRAIMDKHTRDSHRDLDGVSKPISEPFEVGEYLMQFPTDDSLGAGMEEIANCRCSVEYSGSESSAPLFLTLDDIPVHKSVGAKWKNYDILDLETGEKYHFAEGTKIYNNTVFAGKGTAVEYRKAYKYAERFGGKIEDWQHCKGTGIIRTPDGDFKAEVHWSQCDGLGKHDFFIKRWLE